MSDTGINETAYPEVRGETITSWGPAFEGEPEQDNTFSADGLLYGGDVIAAPGPDAQPSIGLVVCLAQREEGPEPLVPQTPITVGVEMTRADLIALRDWANRSIAAMDDLA